MERAALQFFLPTIKRVSQEDDRESVSVCDGRSPVALKVKVDISEPIVGDMLPEPKDRQQTTDSPDWQEWRKAEEVEMHGMTVNFMYKQGARPKDKLLVGTKILYNINIGQDGEVEK